MGPAKTWANNQIEPLWSIDRIGLYSQNVRMKYSTSSFTCVASPQNDDHKEKERSMRRGLEGSTRTGVTGFHRSLAVLRVTYGLVVQWF